MQGLSHTLFEEMLYEDSQLLNPNLVDYNVLTFADLPGNLETIMIENRDGPSPFGAKGLGEGGIVSAAPSAVLELESLGEHRTRLFCEIEFSLMGKLGALGYPMIKHKAGETSKTFAKNLRKELSGTTS